MDEIVTEDFGVICKQGEEVVAYNFWKGTRSNIQRLKDWAKYGYERTDDKYVMGYDGKWYIEGEEPKKPAPTAEEQKKVYENAVQAHLDATAQTRGYDNTYTCISYINSTDEVWRRESNAFNVWRDSIWRKAHEILNAFMRGEIEQPTIEEVIAQLPTIDWEVGVS
jgi:hypothetical protein